MLRLLHKLTYAIALTLISWMVTAAAQQPAPGRQKAPRLTTDDVRSPVTQPVAESKEAAAKSDDLDKAETAETKSGQPKSAESKASPEELAWRERVEKARSHAKGLEKAAEEAELRITTLRNELGQSGQSARYRNDTAAEIGQAGQRLSEIRAQARAAADDAAQLTEYGKQKGFSEAEDPKPTAEEGKPNEDYYRGQFAKLSEALESAQRRVQLYDNRVKDLNQQISSNSGGKDKNGRNTGGDSYFALQLQKDREEAQQKLDEARTAQTQAQGAIDALKEEARRAGVPPGLFR